MKQPPRILLIALVSALGGLVFLANNFSGNNWLFDSLHAIPAESQGLLPIANALGKDLMLDVSPQLHPSVLVGEAANGIKFLHWIDQEIHCEDCLRLEIPDTGEKIGAAFSNEVGYNFEEAKKITFFAMVEEEGIDVQFKAVGNDKEETGTNVNGSADTLFKNQEFALTSQNVTLNQTWSYFEMSLDEVQPELNNVKYPFALEVTQGNGAPIFLYIKGIMYSSEPVDARYLLPASSVGNVTASALSNATTTTLNVTLSDNSTEPIHAPATVEFGASVSNGQEPYSIDWDFGDGAKEVDAGSNITHTFATPGLYNVTANVMDSLNNTGSANTMLDITENETQGSISTNPQNMTNTTSTSPNAAENNQTEQTGDNSTNNSNSTTPTPATEDEETPDLNDEDTSTADGSNTESEPEANNNSTDTETNGLGSAAAAAAPTEPNSPPVADAGNDLLGKPNQKVILDASKSSDPDSGDNIESYQWEQESGPSAKINDKSSTTPIVTLPNVDEDSRIVFSLKVNDGTVDSQDQDTVSIFVDHVDQLANDVQVKVLKPVNSKTTDWIAAGDCNNQGEVNCLSDGSDLTFVTAGTENVDNINLYAFEAFSPEGTPVDENNNDNNLVIDRVTAEITAKKTGNTGYASFAVDDPQKEEHYFTPSLSIGSGSFQKYNFVWEVNPVNGEGWTQDSLNSLIAGFKYDGGQSGVQISELQLTISYHLLPEPTPPAEVSTPQESADAVANDDSGGDDENSTGDVQDTGNEGGATEDEAQQQEEPTTESNGSNSTSAADADEEGGGNESE